MTLTMMMLSLLGCTAQGALAGKPAPRSYETEPGIIHLSLGPASAAFGEMSGVHRRMIDLADTVCRRHHEKPDLELAYLCAHSARDIAVVRAWERMGRQMMTNPGDARIDMDQFLNFVLQLSRSLGGAAK